VPGQAPGEPVEKRGVARLERGLVHGKPTQKRRQAAALQKARALLEKARAALQGGVRRLSGTTAPWRSGRKRETAAMKRGNRSYKDSYKERMELQSGQAFIEFEAAGAEGKAAGPLEANLYL
jgi:hypothetical protein